MDSGANNIFPLKYGIDNLAGFLFICLSLIFVFYFRMGGRRVSTSHIELRIKIHSHLGIVFELRYCRIVGAHIQQCKLQIANDE